jgi:hypothetical protein
MTPRLLVAHSALLCSFAIGLVATAEEPVVLDLNSDAARQTVVDREAGQYLGHVSTCLLDDGKTILCVYPKGHGRGPIVYKRSDDGGKTWSDRLPTPENWATSRETPTLFPTIDAAGKKRILLFSGLRPIRQAISEDDGRTWTPLAPIGEYGGIVPMGDLSANRHHAGVYTAYFHDDGRFFAEPPKRTNPPTMTLYAVDTKNGGVTWGEPRTLFASADIHLCEPGIVRSPDGKTLAMLLRENRRVANSHVMVSTDEGATWTAPVPLPASLTGDRHQAAYAPDGRLVISFRKASPTKSFEWNKATASEKSPFEGDWILWVGRWEDLAGRTADNAAGRPGQYVVRLKDNTKGYDCAYPGVEVLPEGTFVVTTYGHWEQSQPPFILSVRLKLDELDQLARAK